MKNTAKSFLESWGDRRENINNINYDNDCNNLTTQRFHADTRNPEEVIPSPASQSLLASTSSKSRPLGHSGTLPPGWRSLKLDLFANGINADGSPSLKIKLGIITDQKQPVNLTAGLNSKLRYMYYKIEPHLLKNQHWTKVKQMEISLKKQFKGLRGSKCYVGKKDNVVDSIAIFLYQYQDVWHAHLIVKAEEYLYEIDQPGSDSFRRNNGIYTAYYANQSSYAKLISLKELGL